MNQIHKSPRVGLYFSNIINIMIASDLKTEENREFIIYASQDFIDAFERALEEDLRKQILKMEPRKIRKIKI